MSECAYQIRLAIKPDGLMLLEIARSAQDKLTHAGSAQHLAGYSPQSISLRIQRGELYVLEAMGRILGGAFVEPVTPERFPHISKWQVAPEGCPLWFLYGLVIDPTVQGQGWGKILLHGICHQEKFSSPAILTLDCWSGNEKLRWFYLDAGFHLHGEFPEEDYRIAVFTWTDWFSTLSISG